MALTDSVATFSAPIRPANRAATCTDAASAAHAVTVTSVGGPEHAADSAVAPAARTPAGSTFKSRLGMSWLGAQHAAGFLFAVGVRLQVAARSTRKLRLPFLMRWLTSTATAAPSAIRMAARAPAVATTRRQLAATRPLLAATRPLLAATPQPVRAPTR